MSDGRAELRARLHGALDAFLDALDAYRALPAQEELIAVSHLPFDVAARRRLVREGRLRVVRIGRQLYTSRAAVAALVHDLPPADLPGPKTVVDTRDDLTAAAAKRAKRRIAR